MAREGAFEVEGVIVDVLKNGTYRVELANGHRPLGFVAGKTRSLSLAAGDKVWLELSPYDLSKGRILSQASSVNRL